MYCVNWVPQIAREYTHKTQRVPPQWLGRETEVGLKDPREEMEEGAGGEKRHARRGVKTRPEKCRTENLHVRAREERSHPHPNHGLGQVRWDVVSNN